MRRFAFAIPGDLATATGGYAYDRRMIDELRSIGWQIDHVRLGDGFPSPDEATRKDALVRLMAVPPGEPIVVDGLALGVLPEAAATIRARNPLIALLHHPLALETGLTDEQSRQLRESERAALAAATSVIVTSETTARLLVADYAVPAGRIAVAHPGNDPVPLAKGSSDGIVRLLSVGAVVRRKGFDVLIAALAMLTDLPWRLTIAGDRERSPETTARLDADIARAGLQERIATPGVVTPQRLTELYADADVFVLASRFEGYGMAYAEAIAHGLPVIGTHAGAIVATVPADAGILVAPDDAAAFAGALRDVIADAGKRGRLAASARAAAGRLPRWQESARIFSAVLDGVA